MKRTLSVFALALTISNFVFAQRVEESDKSVTLTGGWIATNDPAASGGTYAVSGNAGDTVTYNFTGSGITLWRELDPSGGAATVTIDGQMWGTISYLFNQRAYQIPAIIDQLPNGPHVLILTVSANAPQGSTGTNVYVDAMESPISFAPSAAQQTALTRVNFYRAAVGIPAANLSTAIDLAAQAHSDWLGANNMTGHVETPGTPSYIGAQFGDRLNYFGYDRPASEDWSGYSDPTSSVDQWMDSVYHRTPLMTYAFTDIGWGSNATGGSTLDFGNKRGTAPANRQVSTYPANNQTGVPLIFPSGESPDPFNGTVTYPAGYPISVHIDQAAGVTPGTDTVANSGTLTDQNGNAIPFLFMDRNSDAAKFLADDYFILPTQPLATSTTYTAAITGTDLQGHQFNVTWSFTTIPNATVVQVLPFAGDSTSIWIQWDTAGPVMTTSLQFGTTTAYGTTLQGSPNNPADPLAVAANLTGLTPNTTYHYQITATDAQGNTGTSADMTFTTLAQ